MELKRFDSDASAKFSMHTIPSDRLSESLSLKNVVQKEKKSKKRICWIVTNVILGTALFVNLFFSIENQHYSQVESPPENHIIRNLTLSVAIEEVREFIL